MVVRALDGVSFDLHEGARVGSAGDAEFIEKAQTALRDVVDRPKIPVLASHDTALIKVNCNQIMRLSHGKLVSLDPRACQRRIIKRIVHF